MHDRIVTTGAETDHAANLRFEEFKALRREIEYLDQRIERSQYTMLLVNAVVLTAIYAPGGAKAVDAVAPTLTPEQVAALAPTVLAGLLALNFVMAVKYISQGRHIDTIGDYLARLETSVYGQAYPELGWERMMRTPGALASRERTVKSRPSEGLRRYGVWFFLVAASFAAFAHRGLWPWLLEGAF
ncbi:MAG: hypothetical protein AAF322_13395 [Pseudomonadota bacterium]